MLSWGRIHRTWQGREREKCKAAQRSLTWAAGLPLVDMARPGSETKCGSFQLTHYSIYLGDVC